MRPERLGVQLGLGGIGAFCCAGEVSWDKGGGPVGINGLGAISVKLRRRRSGVGVFIGSKAVGVGVGDGGLVVASLTTCWSGGVSGVVGKGCCDGIGNFWRCVGFTGEVREA